MKQSGYHTQTPSDYTRKLNPNFLLSNEYQTILSGLSTFFHKRNEEETINYNKQFVATLRIERVR
ncbi:hypothetical protein DERF_005727 [Dermatophagoides farinae]|uniref:Uncharacterized protein n=1 Tax=Dermatophagoides farinae TaxID=6954 RepID=A0A922I421_DERFA|nr:hypothetical protein DERF_005727 [Dermatophagoides farinae]